MQSALGGALQNNQLAGGVNASAINGIQRDLFGLLTSVGPNGVSRGENRDYTGAGQKIMGRYGIGESNPMYKQIMEILEQAGKIQEGIKKGAENGAKMLLPGGADTRQTEIFTAALDSAKPLVDISTYTALTADRLKDLAVLLAGRKTIEEANSKNQDLNRVRIGKAGEQGEVANKFEADFSSIGIRENRTSLSNSRTYSQALKDRKMFADAADRIAGSNISRNGLDETLNDSKLSVYRSIREGGAPEDIYKRIMANKDNEPFLSRLAPGADDTHKERAVKELIVGASGQQKTLDEMMGLGDNIDKLQKNIDDMKPMFNNLSEAIKSSEETYQKAVDENNRKTATGYKNKMEEVIAGQKVSVDQKVKVDANMSLSFVPAPIDNEDFTNSLKQWVVDYFESNNGGVAKPDKVAA